MIPIANILLDIPRLGRKYADQETEKSCSAKWRLEASGPTRHMCRPIRGFAARTRCAMGERDVPAMPNTRSMTTGCGAPCPPSVSACETAAPRISRYAKTASATKHRWTKTSAPSLYAADVMHDGTTNATVVRDAANAAQQYLRAAFAAPAVSAPGKPSTLTHATGTGAVWTAEALTVQAATAGAAPAVNRCEARA